MMHPHAELIQAFYAAFQRRDHRAMLACYTPDAEFHDPVFPNLNGPEVGAMWRMLCQRATDLRIAVGNVQADDQTGTAHWEAWYTFRQTGRPVHNRIDASFRFENGKFRIHEDAFDLYAWARQALGVKGLLFGWASPVQRAIRAQAARALQGAGRGPGDL